MQSDDVYAIGLVVELPGGNVSIKHRFCKILLGLVLGMGVFVGSPMRPEEIEELMCAMSQQTIEYVIPDEGETGDEIIRKLLGQGD